MLVLGIESSCDETGVALYDSARGIVGETLRSQIDLHADFGGVVPELASRDHVRHIIPLVNQTLKEAEVIPADLTAVAYTAGPGLMGSLFVGACVGRTLAYAWQKTPIAVHHLEGHILSALMETETPDFPFICLLVSGGHSQLIQVQDWGDYQILGESLDDAAGEAFDKVAKMLGLGYPGGPKVSEIARKGRPNFKFPRPMLDRPGLEMSFSGLKTAVLTRVHRTRDAKGLLSEQDKADIACAFEEAIVDTLLRKIERAIVQTGIQHLVLAGGVSANHLLRSRIHDVLGADTNIYFPRQAWCTDNAAMIAFAGFQRLSRDLASNQVGLGVCVYPRWPLSDLCVER